MSQYPSPYYPPNVPPPHMPYGGPVDVLAPAKRASILMFILGPLLLCCGGCLLSMPTLLANAPADQTQQLLDRVQSTYHAPPELVFRMMGIIFLMPGLAFFILAFFVRRGGKVAAILSAVLAGVGLAFSVIGLLVNFMHPTADIVSGICLQGFVIAVLGLLLVWLIQAASQSSQIKAAQQQYLAQYYQYQQNMQAYAAQGYHTQPQPGQGYAPPATPQIQPPPPPIDPPAPPPTGE
jgi:hypothetical protein